MEEVNSHRKGLFLLNQEALKTKTKKWAGEGARNVAFLGYHGLNWEKIIFWFIWVGVRKSQRLTTPAKSVEDKIARSWDPMKLGRGNKGDPT